jgi:hypothetical protein
MNWNVNHDLLDMVLDNISNELQVLEAVRNENNVITDFKYLVGSKDAYGIREDLAGRSVLSVYPWKKQTGLFDRFVRLLETDEPVDTIVQRHMNGHAKWYHIKAKKFNDGLILYREDITTAKQAEERIMQLNRALLARNRQLEALSSELKTLNTIAANDYNETLKHLYNSMEFIINNDAANLSDAGRANIRRAQAAIQKNEIADR